MHSRADRLGLVFRRCVLGLVVGSVTAGALGLPATAAPPTTPYLSEIHYDNTGVDSGEFVEVHLPAGTTSAGLSVVLYNGSGGVTYDTDPLPPVTAPGGAPAVAVLTYPEGGLQNGSPDGIALVDTGGAVLEFVSYEGAFTATNGPAAGLTSRDIGVAEAGTEPAGRSLSRVYDSGTEALVWQSPAAATPGAVNPVRLPEEPGESACERTPTHEIGDVQGSAASTPLAGQQVTVRGIVVGDLPGFSGFYLQDPDGDRSAATSDGVFVFSSVAVDLGDTVAAAGEAQEFGGQTQISARAEAEVCAQGTRRGPSGRCTVGPAGRGGRAGAPRGHAGPAGGRPDGQRSLRPHQLRRADLVRGRPARPADRAGPPGTGGPAHRRGEPAPPDRSR